MPAILADRVGMELAIIPFPIKAAKITVFRFAVGVLALIMVGSGVALVWDNQRPTASTKPAGEPATAVDSFFDPLQPTPISHRRPPTPTDLTAGLSRSTVRAGVGFTISGTSRARPGSTIMVQRQAGSAWLPVATTRLTRRHTYRVPLRRYQPGSARYRVLVPRTPSRSHRVAGLPEVRVFRSYTYRVATAGTVRAPLAEFRSTVARTLNDPRGWRRAYRSFREIRSGPSDFTVVLAQASRVPSFGAGCSADYSCRAGRYVVINHDRWFDGSPAFSAPLLAYRRMVINHETGHWLGLGHQSCPRPGAQAPLMQQQSKGLAGCLANPWPLRRELHVSRS